MSIKNDAYGFFLDGKWYANTWRGHEGEAFELIQQKGWVDEWRASQRTAQDFLVKYKNAIQLGSNGSPKTIYISSYRSELSIRFFMKEHNLGDEYEVHRII